jgi:hypothetical protein
VTIGVVTAATPGTEATPADGRVLPATAAAADPVATMAMSTPTPPAEAIASANVKTVTRDGTVGAGRGAATGNGIVIGAVAGVGGTTTIGASAGQSVPWSAGRSGI